MSSSERSLPIWSGVRATGPVDATIWGWAWGWGGPICGTGAGAIMGFMAGGGRWAGGGWVWAGGLWGEEKTHETQLESPTVK